MGLCIVWFYELMERFVVKESADYTFMVEHSNSGSCATAKYSFE